MEVKIYREPENASLIINEEDMAEYNELISSLGLVAPNPEKEKIPNVYMHLNKAMEKQLLTLCPVRTPAASYTKTTVPLEVLRVYKYAKDNEMFEGYEIWSDDKNPDPILIGWKFSDDEAREKGYSWKKERCIIARWGDEALELSELVQRGYDKLKQQLEDRAKETINLCRDITDNVDLYTRKVLDGSFSSPTFNDVTNLTIY
jgi:hypothetical protein